MRRNDREITDEQQINSVIEGCDCCRIAFATEDVPYIVPLSFAFVMEGNKRILYFHGAKEGRKIDLIRDSEMVGFEMDTDHMPVPKEGDPCNYTFRYSSVIGKGKISMVEDTAEKIMALEKITQHYYSMETGRVSPKGASAVAVFKVEVTELSCKRHI